MEGLSTSFAGRWRQGRELAERALDGLAKRGERATFDALTANVVRAKCCYFGGDFAELCRMVPSVLDDAWSRGDIAAIVFSGTGISITASLAPDKIDDARHTIENARELWKVEGYYFPDYYLDHANLLVALYAGEGRKAMDLVHEMWRGMKRAMLLTGSLQWAKWTYNRSAAYLAAAADQQDQPSERRALIRAANRWAKKARRHSHRTSPPMSQLLFAGVGHARGNVEEALALLEQAEKGFENTDMKMYSAAVRRRRGVLLGGDEGKELVDSADKAFKDQTVVNPERMTAMLAPGFAEKI
jgi:hypothetical protein